MIEAPGYTKLVTAFYPEGDEWLESDAVFGVKKSLVVVSVVERSSDTSGGLSLDCSAETARGQRRGRGAQARLPEGQLVQTAATRHHSCPRREIEGGLRAKREGGGEECACDGLMKLSVVCAHIWRICVP